MCLAIPGRIEAITDPAPATRRGRVDFGGVRKEIVLAFVPEAGEGDWILAHVGFAIARIDEARARQSLADLGAGPGAEAP
jgi:hydrogenase expression/formation protein HypC